MNKTIYIRDEDVPVWERAKELAGEKLAPVIVEGLKRYIADKDAEAASRKGFGRIVVKYRDAEEEGLPRVKAFNGRWIFPEGSPLDVSEEPDDPLYCAVAETHKGAFVFLSWEGGTRSPWKTFEVLPSLEAALADDNIRDAAIKTIEKRGVPVEELDI
jgi:hypothetical protein